MSEKPPHLDQEVDQVLRQCARLFSSPNKDKEKTPKKNPKATPRPTATEKTETWSPNSLPPPLDRYRIIQQIGEGGMGKVYRAHDPLLKREVAIKTLHPQRATQDKAVQRFVREAKSSGQLRHSNIIAVYDFHQVNDSYFIVMQHIAGGSLEDVLEKHNSLSIEESCQLAIEILSAISYAHRHGIVHRDLKPSNILLDKKKHVFLTDFGLVKFLQAQGSQISVTGEIIGTPAYMSPEQAKGEKVDTRSDIYSTGVILYQMLTGKLPYPGGNNLSWIYQIISEEPKPIREANPKIPHELAQICSQALAKDKNHRYSDAESFKQELAHFLNKRTRRFSLWQPFVAPSRKTQVWLLLGITLVVFCLFLLHIRNRQKTELKKHFLKKAFWQIDQNRNGKIERWEWSKSQELFENLDHNQDKVITRREWLGKEKE